MLIYVCVNIYNMCGVYERVWYVIYTVCGDVCVRVWMYDIYKCVVYVYACGYVIFTLCVSVTCVLCVSDVICVWCCVALAGAGEWVVSLVPEEFAY